MDARRATQKVSIAACLGAALLLSAGTTGAVVSALSTRAVFLVPPPGGATPSVATLLSVACPAGGGCWSVGDYQLPDEQTKPMAVLRSSGRWAQAVDVALPPSADPAGYASFAAVSCAVATTCDAVGTFTARPRGSHSGNQLPMVAFEAHGRWGPARSVELPANAAAGSRSTGYASAVACDRQARCTIVGTYTTAGGVARSFRASTSSANGGVALSRAVALPFRPLPASLGAGAESMSLSDVACGGPATCIAVGRASVGEGSKSVAVVATEVHGTWGQPVAAPLPTTPTDTWASWLSGVSCPTITTCIAVGGIQESTAGGATRTLVEVRTGGGWHWVAPPPAVRGGLVLLDRVSCASPLRCDAVGTVSTTPAGSLVTWTSAVVATGSAAKLTTETVVPLPTGGRGTANAHELLAVACVATGVCTSVGSVADVAPHIIGFSRPVAVTIAAR